MKITALSLVNSIHQKREKRIYSSTIADIKIKAPLFILGHWRSGTTLLHNLLARDKNFTYPTLFQVSNPHTFLYRERVISERLENAKLVKRPMDNVKVTPYSPGEDEFALSVLSLCSPVMGWSFPRQEEHYDRYLTFQEVPKDDILCWKEAFIFFLKKLTWRQDRPILLKSPAHTARVNLLLELFPDARFIHVHRNPYTVFQSTRWLYRKGVPLSHLQRPDKKRFEEGILRRYNEMYAAFFKNRELIPKRQFYEVGFEQLEKNMLDQIAKMYEHLGIPGFRDAEPALQSYAESVANYKKNVYPPLDEPIRRKIIDAWQKSFEEWGYPILAK